MISKEILSWLQETDQGRLGLLWRTADRLRRKHVGGEVHLRGLIEFSNRCDRLCLYCGLRAANSRVCRYHLAEEEIMGCVRRAEGLGWGTVVLQSGENRSLDVHWMAHIIYRIKTESGLAVTLSLGERDETELALFRQAGADRYLLRFETSNPLLFRRIHPPSEKGQKSDRIALLRLLRDLGYEIGSGVMIGIPGQTYEDLAADIALFRKLDLDMIGVGPFLPHPETPLGNDADRFRAPEGMQVPATQEMTCRVIALARLVCPSANIPATTALATLDPENGYELGLQAGANILMPNITPSVYRSAYEIYPNRICLQRAADPDLLRKRILAMGRTIGSGRGDSPRFQRSPRTWEKDRYHHGKTAVC